MNHDYISESNLIDRYALGKLPSIEAEEFEDHFIDCTACVEQLNITRGMVQDLKGFAVAEMVLADSRNARLTSRFPDRHFWSHRSWAFVACCGLAIAGVMAVLAVRRLTQVDSHLRQANEEVSAVRQQYQRTLEAAAESEKQHQDANQQLAQRLNELEQKLKAEGERNQTSVRRPKFPEVNFPIFALVSVVRGQVPTPVEIAPPASSPRFALSIPIEDRRDFSIYRITILSHQGIIVWKQSGFRPDAYHALSLSLDTNFLGPGTYDLRVDGLTPLHKWDTVGSYPFLLAKRR